MKNYTIIAIALITTGLLSATEIRSNPAPDYCAIVNNDHTLPYERQCVRVLDNTEYGVIIQTQDGSKEQYSFFEHLDGSYTRVYERTIK